MCVTPSAFTVRESENLQLHVTYGAPRSRILVNPWVPSQHFVTSFPRLESKCGESAGLENNGMSSLCGIQSADDGGVMAYRT